MYTPQFTPHGLSGLSETLAKPNYTPATAVGAVAVLMLALYLQTPAYTRAVSTRMRLDTGYGYGGVCDVLYGV